MKVNDLFNDIKYKDNLNWLEITLSKLYYSNRGYFLRKTMELDEFKNECYIRLFKYWNYNSFNGALNTYLGKVAESTMLNLYQRMDRDSRRLNYDDNIERIDKEVEEGETPIILKYEDEYLNDEDVIEYIANGTNNKKDYIIIKMYLLGYSMTEIANHLNMSWRMIQYRLKDKYSDMMKQRFYEYVNSR